jgi:8-oxo-dGTP pyrophosphatase MutT (NUDIX family)
MMQGSQQTEMTHAGRATSPGKQSHPPHAGNRRAFPRGRGAGADTRSDEPELILTLRASGLSTHGGEVAFPGGRRDPEDPDLIFTALREAEEEIGLPPGLVEVIGPLSPLISLHGIRVTPYVGVIPDYVEYLANDAEIAAVFSVPLDFFRQDPREHTHRIDYQGRSWYVPSYRFGEYKIWGLTAIMIVELINLLYDDAKISLHQPPKSFINT